MKAIWFGRAHESDSGKLVVLSAPSWNVGSRHEGFVLSTTRLPGRVSIDGGWIPERTEGRVWVRLMLVV